MVHGLQGRVHNGRQKLLLPLNGDGQPVHKFHQLKGSRKYEFAVSVTGNWRITFEFEGDDATNVNLEDYH